VGSLSNLLEENVRVTVNNNDYMEHEKTYMRMKGVTKRYGDVFTKPDYMIVPEPTKKQPRDTFSVVSKFQGWLSLN
jgi:hypothetical protein